MLPMLSMCSQCAQWVFGPLSPVLGVFTGTMVSVTSPLKLLSYPTTRCTASFPMLGTWVWLSSTGGSHCWNPHWWLSPTNKTNIMYIVVHGKILVE